MKVLQCNLDMMVAVFKCCCKSYSSFPAKDCIVTTTVLCSSVERVGLVCGGGGGGGEQTLV